MTSERSIYCKVYEYQWNTKCLSKIYHIYNHFLLISFKFYFVCSTILNYILHISYLKWVCCCKTAITFKNYYVFPLDEVWMGFLYSFIVLTWKVYWCKNNKWLLKFRILLQIFYFTYMACKINRKID